MICRHCGAADHGAVAHSNMVEAAIVSIVACAQQDQPKAERWANLSTDIGRDLETSGYRRGQSRLQTVIGRCFRDFGVSP